MSGHDYVHPAFRGILNAIAPAPNSRICDAGSGAPAGATASERDDSSRMATTASAGPAPTSSQGNLSRSFAQAVADPRQLAYDTLVNLFLAKAPAEGYDRIEQMPPLNGLQRGVILEANPDVQNDFIFEPLEIAAVLRGDLTAQQWLSASTELALRQWLMDDVNREIAKDEAILRASAFDPEEAL